MSVFSTLRYIVNHPLNRKNKWGAVSRFIKWQINTRLNKYPVIYPFTSRAKLIVQKGMTGATGNLYCGLHEFTDMGFLLHFLRPGDFFVDAGANIGSYTVLAAAHAGARTVALEPVPATYEHLLNNIHLNRVAPLVTALNIAAGSEKGTIAFTAGLDTVNHAAVAGEANTISVHVDTLDSLLEQQAPVLMKRDVEGFETELIRGASGTLANTALRAIIIELNGSGARYGYNEHAIHDTLLSHSFTPFCYEPFSRTLTGAGSFGAHNTIYIRDIDFVSSRIKEAPTVHILKQSF
jgi:FkbM family methyltransferase